MRVLLLLLVGAIFLTGLVWWIVFLSNTVLAALRKR